MTTLLADGEFKFVELLMEEILLRLLGHGNAFKAGVGYDDGIPIPRGDAAHQLAAFV